MENPQKNKETACVFARYLDKEYGWQCGVVLPETRSQPLFDAKLVSSESEELLLQMKQVVQGDVEFMRSKKGQSGMGKPGKDWKMFKNSPIAQLVKKSEEQYASEAGNLILILHDDEGYLIPRNADSINPQDFVGSNFRGIYLVSPKHEFFGVGGRKVQDEFVFEIKNAFG